jgi:transcriptional regulator with XRE-family HTH domain
MNEDRLKRGWTNTALAREAGLSVPTVTSFLAGMNHSPKTAKKLAAALGFSVSRYVRDVREKAAVA